MKRGIGIVCLALFVLIVVVSFVSAISISINPSSGGLNNLVTYNISINNNGGGYNITRVDINIYNLNASSIGSDLNTSNLLGTTYTFFGNISNQTNYFWFNDYESLLGTFNLNITTTNISSDTSSQNTTITISDIIPPTASFASPTPSGGSTLNYSYIPANVTASDSGSGLKNITIYLYNSTEELVESHTGTSSPYLYNFTSRDDGTYYINATAYDNSNNKYSISTITITINTASACTPSWTCGWSECINNTQTKINCVDSNSCGATAPTGNQTCVSCTTNWNCTGWTPTLCSSGSNQTRICTDLNDCTAPSTETRTCVITSASNANASGKSLFSSSFLFFAILGIIILSIAGVFFALSRMKKKSRSSNPDDESGYRSYTPRGPPPSTFPPPGYANPPRVLPNQPQGY